MLDDRVANGIIVLVTLAWAANFAARFVDPSYHPDETINAVFMAIVGGAFALKRKQGKDDEGT